MTETTTKRELIYIATRLTASHPIDYLYNLKQSLKAAAAVWRKGHYPLVPGLDFMIYLELDGEYGHGEKLPYEMSADIMCRCDSVLFENGLEDSNGVKFEHSVAVEKGIKRYYSRDEIPIVVKVSAGG